MVQILASVLVILIGCQSKSEMDSTDNMRTIVFLISEDPNNYEAHVTIPEFARQLEENFRFKTQVLLGNGPQHAYEFPDLSVLADADLLVVFCRRLALSEKQMQQIKDYISSGKPVMGIRTANHAFSVRDAEIPEGFTDWWDFVPEVLGSNNKGYGPVDPGTDIYIESTSANHPILQGIDETFWHSTGNVYIVDNTLDEKATVLLRGRVEEAGLDEPVVWVWENVYGGKVFYSSVGHPEDFNNKDNIKILNQAIAWLIQQTY